MKFPPKIIFCTEEKHTIIVRARDYHTISQIFKKRANIKKRVRYFYEVIFALHLLNENTIQL